MIYWCKKCKTPVFDKGLHSCSCDGKITKISESSICNPVFKQEKKILEKIMDCDYGDKIIWYLGASKYYIDEKIVKVPYKMDITHLIKFVDNHEYQIILEQRYLCFKTWEQISVDMGYSIQHTFRLHDKALKEVGRIYEDES